MKKKLISGMLAICLVGSIPVYPATANAEPATKHMHSFACHEKYNLVCTDDHEHSETCYETNGDLVCGLDEGTGHIHNKNGYECRPVGRIVVCGKEEHIHGDECYTEEEKPFEKAELPETGFFEEYDYSVSQEETDFDENETDITPATHKVLDCKTDEHIHTDECYMQAWECRKKATEELDSTEDSLIRDTSKAELPKIVPFEQGTLGSNAETNSTELPKIVSFDQDILEGDSETANDVISDSVSAGTDEEADETTEESTPVEGEEEEVGGEDGGEEEEIDEIEIDKSYVYDNDMFHMTFHVSGYVNKGEYTGDISDIKEQDLDFQMKMVSEDSEEYQAYVDYLNENSDISNLPFFQAMDYSLNYHGIKLDIDACDVIVNILPTQKLLDILNHSYSNMDFSMVVSRGDRARTIIDDGGEIGGEDPGIEEGGDEEEGDVIEGPSEPGTEESDGPSIADGTAGWEMCGDSIPICKNIEQHTREFDISGFLLGIHIEPMAKTSCNVQYYFDWEKIAYNNRSLYEEVNGYGNELPVINTHYDMSNTIKPDLPHNGEGPNFSPNGSGIRSLYINNATGKLKTQRQLTKLYETREQEYDASSFFDFANIVKDNPNYILKEIWILKPGKDSNSVRREDWTIYENNDNICFSNCAECASADNNCIYIENGSIIRFVYETTESNNDFATDFYDYDISDGKIYKSSSDALSQVNALPTSTQNDTETFYAHTEESGINNPLNHHKEGAKFAFGNANTGTGLQHQDWKGNLINKNNQAQSGHPWVQGTYKGCTFGLVTGMSNGKIQYVDGVSVPNLFNDGSAIGKTNYDKGQYSLKFRRVGDTYTLNAVNGTNTSNLDTFNHPSPSSFITHYNIWTNNFWPMDSAGSFGTDGHDMKFGRTVRVDYIGNDGENHSQSARWYAGKGFKL